MLFVDSQHRVSSYFWYLAGAFTLAVASAVWRRLGPRLSLAWRRRRARRRPSVLPRSGGRMESAGMWDRKF
jgi:hypothetical protein